MPSLLPGAWRTGLAVLATALPVVAVPALATPALANVALANPALASPVTAASPAAAAATLTAGCLPAGGSPVTKALLPTSGALIVTGHGWGHSLGMSQYGAQGAARLGCSATTILQTYYPGTSVTARTLRPTVRLKLLASEPIGRSTVTAQIGPLTWAGTAVAGGTSTATQPQGQTWLVKRYGNGAAVVDGSGTRRLTAAAGAVLRVRERGSVARVVSYGGTSGNSVRTDLRMRWDDTEFTGTSAGLTAEQVLRDDATAPAVQKYLWGLAEVPASWPSAALQTQAVAARTYLVGGYADTKDPSTYRIGTTTATQHYSGYPHEAEDLAAGGTWRAAVNATARRIVVTPDGKPINAFFTSSHGGRSEDARYVWGGTGSSYLRPVDDSRWDRASSNPYRSWAVGLSQPDVARRLGLDSVTDMRVAAPGTVARLAGVTVTGFRGGVQVQRTLTGWSARQVLGVRSPSFTLRWVLPRTSQPLAGDFDGDGRGDVGWFAGGRVTLLTAAGVRRAYLLGAPGDRAVVGDWNGDGKDSVAVRHGNVWCLRNALSSGPCDTQFAWGLASDTPIAGHWRAGTVDGIGVWRGGRWLLRHTPTPGAVNVDIQWGASTDRPVVGDWNADGTDTQGVVRDGTWHLANRLVTRTATAVRFAYGRGTDRVLSGFWGTGRRSLPATVGTSSTFYLRTALSSGPVSRRVVLDP